MSLRCRVSRHFVGGAGASAAAPARPPVAPGALRGARNPAASGQVDRRDAVHASRGQGAGQGDGVGMEAWLAALPIGRGRHFARPGRLRGDGGHHRQETRVVDRAQGRAADVARERVRRRRRREGDEGSSFCGGPEEARHHQRAVRDVHRGAARQLRRAEVRRQAPGRTFLPPAIRLSQYMGTPDRGPRRGDGHAREGDSRVHRRRTGACRAWRKRLRPRRDRPLARIGSPARESGSQPALAIR